MPEKLSTHLPQVSGDLDAVIPAASGTLVIDTGLRDLLGFSCSLAQDAVANASSVSWEGVTQVAGTTKKITLKVWKADGVTAASVASVMSWIAIGN